MDWKTAIDLLCGVALGLLAFVVPWSSVGKGVRALWLTWTGKSPNQRLHN